MQSFLKLSGCGQTLRNIRVNNFPSLLTFNYILPRRQFSSHPDITNPVVRIHKLNARPLLSQQCAGMVSQQIRLSSSILGELTNPPGAIHKRIRRGRGPSSGKGKTSGRGHKGQKARGHVPAGFEGGQTPLAVARPDRGTGNTNLPSNLCIVNVDKIQEWVDQGRLLANTPITLVDLYKSRCIHQVKEGVKLLARNPDSLKVPIHITVARASASAIAAVEKAGGSVTTRYYTKFGVTEILAGTMHPTVSLRSHPTTQPLAYQPSKVVPSEILENLPMPLAATITKDTVTKVPLPTLADGTSIVEHPDYSKLQELRRPFRYRLPDPVRRVDLEYYRDPAHRGYLSYELGENESPSLFYAAYEPTVVDGQLQIDESNPPKRVRDDIARSKTKHERNKQEAGDDNAIFNI